MAITFGKSTTRNESIGNYISHIVNGQLVVIETENARVQVIVYAD